MKKLFQKTYLRSKKVIYEIECGEFIFEVHYTSKHRDFGYKIFFTDPLKIMEENVRDLSEAKRRIQMYYQEYRRSLYEDQTIVA